jgi:hypothetical protein
MALKKKALIGMVDFIHPEDDAIDLTVDEETGQPVSNVAEYRKDWNFSKHCALLEGVEPTKFQLNFSIPYNKQVKIKNASVGGFGKDEDAGFKLGSHSNQIVRTVLVGIKNPEAMPLGEQLVYARDKKTDLVTDRVMEELENLGIVDDIYGFYLSNKAEPENLKKS